MVVFQQPSKWDSIALLRSHPHLEFHGIPNSDGYQFFCVSVASFFLLQILFHFTVSFSFFSNRDFALCVQCTYTRGVLKEPGHFYSLHTLFSHSPPPPTTTTIIYTTTLCDYYYSIPLLGFLMPCCASTLHNDFYDSKWRDERRFWNLTTRGHIQDTNRLVYGRVNDSQSYWHWPLIIFVYF